MKKWVCPVCGYVYEGDTIPEDFMRTPKIHKCYIVKHV